MIAVDWDGTLYGDGDWLPDAKRALKVLRRRGHTIIVHSCRAKYVAGEQSIRDTLAAAGLNLDVTATKPDAAFYVDDRAIRFDGDWSQVLCLIRTQ